MKFPENAAPYISSCQESCLAIPPISIEAIQQWLFLKLAEQLSIPAHSINPEASITSLGLDSMDAVIIAGELEDWLGIELPSTLLWDFDTITKISYHLFDTIIAVRQQQ